MTKEQVWLYVIVGTVLEKIDSYRAGVKAKSMLRSVFTAEKLGLAERLYNNETLIFYSTTFISTRRSVVCVLAESVFPGEFEESPPNQMA